MRETMGSRTLSKSPRYELMGALVCELGHERVDSDGEDMHAVILDRQSMTCVSV
jgi:hypothetical protein